MKVTRNVFVAAMLLTGLAACNNNDSNDDAISDQNVAVAQELMNSETMESELSASINSAILLSEQSYSESSATAMESKSTSTQCGEVSLSPLVGFPKTITVDYGDGCTDSYGLTRSGSIAITVSDDMGTPGMTYRVVFNNFALNGYTISGTFEVENTGTESQPAFSENMDLTFTGSAGLTIHKAKSVERIWLEGASTEAFSDDVYQITGSADVESSNGYAYSYDITTPLRLEYGCDPITKGIIVLSISSQTEPVTIDFGDGTCDWKAKLSQSGKGEMEVTFGE